MNPNDSAVPDGAKPAKILIADDNAMDRAYYRAALSYAGYEVLEAADGAEALAMVRRLNPALVLADLTMPVLDGYALAQAIRADAGIAATHVIFCTAVYDGREAQDLAAAMGGERFLNKPVDLHVLLATIREVLGSDLPAVESTMPREELEQAHLRVLNDKLLAKLAELEAEIAERQQAEMALRESESKLEKRVEKRTAELTAANAALKLHQTSLQALLQRVEKLQRSNQLLLNSIGEGVYGVDIGGQISFANPALERILGWTSAELIGENSHALFHHTRPDGSPYPLKDCPLCRTLRSGDVLCADSEVFWRKDGEAIPVEYTTHPIQEGGQIVGAVVVFKDITRRKQAERELRRSCDELKRMGREIEETQSQLLQSEKMASIGQLAAGVAHEINNPIGFVSSNLGSLQRYFNDLLRLVTIYEQAEAQLPADSAVLQAIAEAKREADFDYLKTDLAALLQESRDGVARVKGIVQDLKDFSRVGDTGWVEADLHEGLDSTLNVVWHELKYKARVFKEYGKLPSVLCMASQLNQVFMNLLVNAAQAIEQEGSITIRTGADEERVWVEIADTGKGIPPENLSRIFDPFFTTKPVGIGTGLGLSISYGIIRKHGGSIEVASQVGEGSTFRIALPRRQAAGVDESRQRAGVPA